jgi:hypothetical protein
LRLFWLRQEELVVTVITAADVIVLAVGAVGELLVAYAWLTDARGRWVKRPC